MKLNIVGLLQSQSELISIMNTAGFSFVPSQQLQAYLLAQSECAMEDWQQFSASWNDMPLDEYMADGGRYRRRDRSRDARLPDAALPAGWLPPLKGH